MQASNQPAMTREQAMATFALLVRRYGLQWTASVPREAYETLNRCNAVLTYDDRREALGLPSLRRS